VSPDALSILALSRPVLGCRAAQMSWPPSQWLMIVSSSHRGVEREQLGEMKREQRTPRSPI